MTNLNKTADKKKWREKSREEINQYKKGWYLKNLEKQRKYKRDWMKKWRIENQEKAHYLDKLYTIKYKEARAKHNTNWYQRKRELSPEYLKELGRRQYMKFKEKILARCKARYAIPEVRNARIASISTYQANRIKTDPRFKLRRRFSSGVAYRLRRRLIGKGNKSTFQYLDYSIDDLMAHLEKQFVGDMAWNNYGKWHIDHIKPDCLFNYKSPTDEEFKKCWDLSNLQPLWAQDNLRKSKSYVEQ